ncbi:hypothetical protein [Photobacterium kishitanii]|uniref:hypothetical protein n=1 Tax=Photobacterium kishitanii TaxID=318456 RepID=UPI000D170B66|nr:hypothetical protein [Photobacterium kishitanii]PSV25497.1 hypothetical protein C0W28_00825 [Photobacterium kishitanii]
MNQSDKLKFAYVDLELMSVGFITCKEISKTFGVSLRTATNVISKYNVLNASAMRYSNTAMQYQKTPVFKPLIVKAGDISASINFFEQYKQLIGQTND